MRVRATAAFEENVRSMIRAASSQVAKGLTAYLDAWMESQARHADQ